MKRDTMIGRPPALALAATGAALILATLGVLGTPAAGAITKDEVITLTSLGVPEGDIIKQIDKDKTVFDLKIQDILELKKANVSDAVLKYMLATPQKYGKGAAPATTAPATATPGAEPATAAPATAEPVVREKTPEEIRAEEERLREEARRLAEEQKKAEEARRKAYTRGVLRTGLDLAERGEWIKALDVFQRFLQEGNFGPGSDEFYNARYGMAAALANAKLYQSSAKLLVDVLLEGPDKPFFKEAFEKLRVLRKEIIYSPPDLEQLTKFSLAGYSQAFQDEFNYVLGEFFYDFGNYQRALKHFEAVSDKTADGARALYLTGLVQVRYKMWKSAVESLQKAIDIADRTDADRSVQDLAYMALARVAYENDNQDAAIFYYKKVPRDSQRAPQVFYELAWTYFLKGDFSRALGTFHALHSPYFAETFFPELWILEARVYGDLCRYDQAMKALQVFDRQVGMWLQPLKGFINAQKLPEDFYNNFLASINEGRGQNLLPKKLAYPVLSNVEFYNLYKTVRQLEKETEEISRAKDRLGNFASEMLVRLGMLRKDSVVRTGVKVQQILKDLEVAISEAQVNQTEIEVDINAAAIEKISDEMRALVGEGEEEGDVQTRSTAVAIIGGDTEVWPWEGEYWLDEVPYYRSLLTSQCVQ